MYEKLQFSIITPVSVGGDFGTGHREISQALCKSTERRCKNRSTYTKKPSVHRTESFGPTNLALGELGSTTGGLQTVLLTLLHARVTGQEASLLDRGLQIQINLHQSTGDAVTDGASLEV